MGKRKDRQTSEVANATTLFLFFMRVAICCPLVISIYSFDRAEESVQMEVKENREDPQSWKCSSLSSEDGPCVLECGTSLAEQEYESKFHDTTANETETARKKTLDQSLKSTNLSSLLLAEVTDLKDLRDRLARDIMTQHPSLTTFTSPIEDPLCSDPNHHKFLELPLVYGDQTASNRPVQSIEEYLQRVCLPLYGNTHTNTSITGSQSTALVAEARQMVAEACNAKITGKASLDAVLFA